MSMLTCIQYFCRRTGLPVPSTVYGSTDTQVLQAMALLEEEGNDLAMRHGWQALTVIASHTTVATESQGAMATIASNGFRYIKNDTIWDQTLRLPVIGPVDGQEWEALKAVFINGPRYRYRIQQGNLLCNPVPVASNTWAFEYVSKNWITDSTGATYRQYFSADADLILLPEDLCLAGLRWRWKKEKGFDYAEDFRTYETQVNAAMSRDGGKRTLYMDSDSQRGPVPGIFVSPGSWI